MHTLLEKKKKIHTHRERRPADEEGSSSNDSVVPHSSTRGQQRCENFTEPVVCH